ncbi:DUF2789 domain-containing protein [Thalassotalea atypica]|uniref:DUF2789 domain-containing protein n=1 Tax=Thalassotalea atypica TaxID=2054316 RepID=UPI0025732820|nr:DUF2789 domain-containing protein [Thalassotalea atypica]
MDRSNHTLPCLFAQLGLENSDKNIEEFLNLHRGIPSHTTLAKAHFWSDAQASFLSDAISEDSDWAEIVDTLDTMLR